MSDINKLREQVLREQAKTKEKKRRLEKKTGARINGSKVDPVKPVSWVANARSRDLERHLNRLKSFNSRKTQFVSDANRNPIHSTKWKEFQTELDKFNSMRSTFYDSVKDIKTPSGVTIDKASQLRTGKYVTYVDDFRRPKTVSSRAFTSEKALNDAIKRYRKMNKSEAEGMMKDSRANFLSIILAEGASAPDWANTVSDLTDKQFFMLWSSTDFKKLVGSNYKMMKEGVTKHNSDMISANDDSINQLLDWVTSAKVEKQLNARVETLAPNRAARRRKR